MEQIWRLMNLDSRRFIEPRSFKRYAITGLHDFLVKPVEVLDTLEAMRQRSEYCVQRLISEDSWRDFRRRWCDASTGKRRIDYPLFLPEQSTQAECTLIVKLPPELLCYVADLLLGVRWTPIADCMALAMTCQRVYAIVRPRLNKKLACSSKNWAGDRIICIGNGYTRGEVPAGVFTEAELVEYGLSTKPDDPMNLDTRSLFHTPYTSAGWMYAKSKADSWTAAVVVPRGMVPSATTDPALLNLFQGAAFAPPEARGENEASSMAITSAQILIVRSITAREYIRRDLAEAKTQEPRFSVKPFPRIAHDLGEVAFYAMMWSGRAAFEWRGGPAELQDALHHGRWAGHRIDVTHIQTDEFEVELAGWTDVTQLFVDIAFEALLPLWPARSSNS